MITTAKIVDYDGDCLTLRPDGYIDTELMRKSVDKVEIRLVDGRTITAEQRKKAYALINDIARWSAICRRRSRHTARQVTAPRVARRTSPWAAVP